MHIRALILATLAASLVDCTPDTGMCDAPMEDVKIDMALTQADIDAMIEAGGLGGFADIECEDACAYAYALDSEWMIDDMRDCELTIESDGKAEMGAVRCDVTAVEYGCAGRRPLGHVEVRGELAGLAGHLAYCASLERASVVAFEELAGQLAGWGAPSALVERCRRAAAEETGHAARLGALAELGGASMRSPERVSTSATRLDVALHNAVEGCVYEAWAAVCAAWMAERAQPRLRAVYASIAPDEAGHAELAWDVHAWLIGQLTEDEVERVLAAQRAALEGLTALAVAEALASPPELGLPGAPACGSMARRFAAGLAA